MLLVLRFCTSRCITAFCPAVDRVHEAAGGEGPTGFIATWCNHGASEGPLLLQNIFQIFGHLFWEGFGEHTR